MTTTNHKDLSKVVLDHFVKTGTLHPEVQTLDPGVIEELIDAIPNNHPGLIAQLVELLQREGVR